MATKVKEEVKKIAVPIIEELGFELVDVEYKKEGKHWFLRVFIDQEQGVGLEECQVASERLSEKLDEEDPIKGAYYLEVSSPGAERPLRTPDDFRKAVGKNIYAKTYEQVEGQKEFEGRLDHYEDEELIIVVREKTRTKTYTVPLAAIATARLSVLA